MATTPTNVRLDTKLLARIDAVVASMAKRPEAAAEKPTRTKVIVLALLAGLPLIEKRIR